MGIDYTALLYVGKQFDDASEATDFLRDKLGFTDEEEREIDEDGLSEFLYGENRFNLNGDILNYYTDWGGFVVGIQLDPRQYDSFIEQVQDAYAHWSSLFPDVEADIIHTVQVS